MAALQQAAPRLPGAADSILARRRAKWESFWSAPRAEADATHRRSVELIQDQLAPQRARGRPLRILDLGCGSGRVLELLQLAGDRVVGLDLAAGAVQTARSRLSNAPQLIQADAFNLALADGSFDAVVSLGYASVGSYPGVQDELAR